MAKRSQANRKAAAPPAASANGGGNGKLVPLLVVAIGLFTVWQLMPAPPSEEVLWKPYSKKQFDAAVRQGKPVVIEFAADW